MSVRMKELEWAVARLGDLPDLIEALCYWLPDETMIPKGHEEAWHRTVELLARFEGIGRVRS